MNTTLRTILMAAAVSVAGGLSVTTLDAVAQNSTSGAVRGLVKDKATGEPVIATTVVATSAALIGEQIVLTDDNGQYYFDNLPPGEYVITVYFNDAKFERKLDVSVGKLAQANVTVSSATAGETVIVKGQKILVDSGSSKIGSTITKEFVRNIPAPRTFGGLIGATAGSQNDQYGASLSGATSAENTYIVEGINTTDTGFGTLAANLPSEFIDQTEIVTGGYNAEFGRATGGVINVLTKQGSDEFHGSVFGYFRNGDMAASAKLIDRQGSSVDRETNIASDMLFGAEVGGPIIKKKLWFHVGIAPALRTDTITRIVNRNVDADGDFAADVDPNTGFNIQERVTSYDLDKKNTTYFFTGKINGQLSPDHGFVLSTFGNPATGNDFRQVGGVEGREWKTKAGALDGAFKWNSKFLNDSLQFDLLLGYHTQVEEQNAVDPTMAQIRYDGVQSLSDFANIEAGIGTQCNPIVDPNNPDNVFDPCPVALYNVGGLGFLENRTNNRMSLVAGLTYRVKLAGSHIFKLGFDGEQTSYDALRRHTGGRTFRQDTRGRWTQRQFVGFDAAGDIACGFDGSDADGDPDFTCSARPGGLAADTKNQNLGIYLQDSWQILTNLTANLGVRWERQTGFVAESLVGQQDPSTGEVIPEKAYTIDNMISPRLGLIFDPTNEGRSKLFAHWGRFYEAVPMDINVRAFGGEITNFRRFNAANCDVPYTTRAEMETALGACFSNAPDVETNLGGGTEYVAPNLKGQFSQDIIVGAEHQLMDNFKVGLTYVNKKLPVVIEDVSTDGGNTYMIANPGEDFSAEADDLRELAAANPDLADIYNARADQLDAVSLFDKPVRTYDAIKITAEQRPTDKSLLLASYTYSRSKGNYPGLFSTETGQLDPNLTSMYDLPDLMANRYGAMGLDRPHNLKVDGFYMFDLGTAGMITAGGTVRMESGIPHNTLGGHAWYGDGESFLLPRGIAARSPVTWAADIRAQYGYRINKSMRAELFVDVYNLFNNQDQLDVDEVYTYDYSDPVVDGDMNDLKHAKSNLDLGLQTNATVIRNPNYGNLNTRRAPLSAQIGARFSF